MLDMEGKGVLAKNLACEVMELVPRCIARNGAFFNIAVYHPKRIESRESIQFINMTMSAFGVAKVKLSFPNSPIEVVGLTLEEARQKIQECYQEQIQDIEIFLNYRGRLSK